MFDKFQALRRISDFMISYVFTFLAMFGFWLIFSGHFHGLLIFLGLVSALIVTYFSHTLFFPEKKVNIKLILKIFAYAPTLIKEIVLANIQVLKILLKKDITKEIDPQMVEFVPKVKSDIGITMLANSITLTPGTVTIIAKEDKFLVHALTKEFADGLFDSDFEKKILNIEESI
jgi:multicomponent Na+:H+ antiporter subunit E